MTDQNDEVYDKCPKCTLNPDSMIASCVSEGCPIWRNPIPTKEQVNLFQTEESNSMSQTSEPKPLRGERSCIFQVDESPFQVVPDAVEMVSVDKKALRQVLEALNGPMHLIRELQVTRVNPNLPPLVIDEKGKPYLNPIDTLVRNFNDSFKS